MIGKKKRPVGRPSGLMPENVPAVPAGIFSIFIVLNH